MPQVVIIQVIYNNRNWLEPVFNAIFNQTFKDFKVVAVIAGNEDGGKEWLINKFPQVKIIDPNYNIGFAKGHNLVFNQFPAEFYQLVNPDLVMMPNYIEEMLKVFNDKAVGGATGKLYQIQNSELALGNLKNPNNKILDSTGVIIKKSGRAFDRGQHKVDLGQYDQVREVDAVSGAGCMYRSSALHSVAEIEANRQLSYFDESFHSYWEDVDLSWRMKNAGWKNVFVPTAVGYHGRTAGSAQGGYLHFVNFVRHHRALPLRIRQLNYKNHILMYIKNSPYFYPQFFIREFFMFFYILIFETQVLKVFPSLVSALFKIWKKRQKYVFKVQS